METDNIEVDEILGVNVIIMKRGRSPRKKSRQTLTVRDTKMTVELNESKDHKN